MGKFELDTYVRMLKAGLNLDTIQQRISVDIQCCQFEPLLQKFVDGYLAKIKGGEIQFNEPPSDELISPLLNLAKSKYERLLRRGFKKEQINFIKIYDGDNDGEKITIPVDPSSYGIREYGTEHVDKVMNDDVEEEEKNYSLIRAMEQKKESTELRDNLYSKPEVIDEIIMSLREIYSKSENDGKKKKKEDGYDESPTSLSNQNDDKFLNKLRVKPEYDESPQPEIFETMGAMQHSITKLDFKRNILIPERMYIVENLFGKDYCEQMIDYLQFKGYEVDFQKRIQESEILAGRIIMRTSLRRKFIDPEVAKIVWEAVKDMVPKKLEDGRELKGIRSKMNFYKYSEGEFFNTHVDGGYRYRDTGESSEYTFIVYLNDDFEGGSTRFCDIDYWETAPKGVRQVNAKQGNVLIFRQPNMKHCGTSIKSGTKYIIQGMVMYGPTSYNRIGRPVGKKPYDFKPMVCDCD